MPAVTFDDFSQHTQRMRDEINAALARYTEYDDDCPPSLAEAIRYSLLAGGKRLRPMLVLMATESCGCDRGQAMPAACAVEMIHTYSLIHDDLPAMDDDDLRRGLPSCHKKFGESTAILAGDALLTQAFEVLGDLSPPEVVARCCRELARAAGPSSLVGGQVDDLAAEFESPDLARLERIHRRKTGAMFRVSLRLGGIVGQGSSEQIDKLDTYGKKIGLAFQVVDDLLDQQGDEHQLGKRTGKDSEHGKMTFPGVLGVESSREKVQTLIAEAIDALQGLGDSAASLVTLAQFVRDRDR